MPTPQDYRIFVGAFPGGELAERIQAARLRLDRRTAEITPPHVTLAGTYWRSGPATAANERATVAPAIERLQIAASQIAPFELLLGGVSVFPPADRPVIYLQVQATPELLAARRALLAALGPDKHRQFTPHLTLAMRLSVAAAGAARRDFERQPWSRGPQVARISELRLMQRSPNDPAWRAIAVLPLGGGA